MGGPVQLTINAYDGISPQPITLPATAPGQTVKTEIVPTMNKGLLYQFSAVGSWAPLLDESELLICQWGRSGYCVRCPGLGGQANA